MRRMLCWLCSERLVYCLGSHNRGLYCEEGEAALERVRLLSKAVRF